MLFYIFSPLYRYYNIFLLIFSTVVLQGCVTGALIGTAAITTKSITDPRSLGTQIDDSALEAKISNALANNKQIKHNARIIPTAYAGNVLLTGQSPNQKLIEQSQQIAQRVAGTKMVYNEIRIGKPVNLDISTNDTWITTKARSQLLISNQVKSSNIKITTENGEIFLMGVVTPSEGKAAAEIISHINGIKRVIKVFTYIK